jgi:predicted cupin superfamily sugar epimerase
MNKRQLIEKLSLEPHIEGGYFSRTHSSELKIAIPPQFETKKFAVLYFLHADR